MSNLIVHLHFLEPYRLVNYADQNPQRLARGISFARWRERSDKKGWEIIITGTLLRSATLRAAEEILCINNGIWEGQNCCNGTKFLKSEPKDKNKPLRKRPTLIWSEEKTCGGCPFCQLLQRHIFSFGNLTLNSKRDFPQDFLREIASERILNRIDPGTGKAFDYFKVWEVKDERFWHFKGKIEINGGDDNVRKAIKLLTDSLRFIDKLCGALCLINIIDDGTNQSTLQNSYKDKEDTPQADINSIVEETAKTLTALFEKTNSFNKLRPFADAIRALRHKGQAYIEHLPAGKEEEHFIWDKIYDGKRIREIIKNCAEKIKDPDNWRRFCESLGQKLYENYKTKSTGIVTRERILGDTEYYSRQAPAGDMIFIKSGNTVNEWIFIGQLIAETPFFFGTEAKGGEQINIQILLTKDGRYRIPRSVLRGTLRNDLRYAEGTGCNVELGSSYPCDCPVCRIMRQITIMDTRSSFAEPPEIRHRIRKNPFTGTVEEGALFDIEVGPEGVSFPFIMRYRGGDLPGSLKKVLNEWTQGRAFLGGNTATGKGRFLLKLEHIFKWELNKDTLNEYIQKHGLRAQTTGFDIDKAMSEQIKGLQRIPELEKIEYDPPWHTIEYSIKVISPFHTADPVAALLDSGDHDSVVFEKRVLSRNGVKNIPVYKGESIRGLIRAALARRLRTKNKDFSEDHEDCECELCQIFGNEHRAGKIRFEDLSIEGHCKKRFDHVAIDRFTSGAAEKKKFDDCSIVATPSSPIILKGKIFIRKDIGEENLKKLQEAFSDVRDGLYPLGGKTGTGYGMIETLEISQSSLGFTLEPRNENMNIELTSFPYPPLNIPFEKDAVYYPHYFIKPAKYVNRSIEVIGHERFYKGLLTGKIECTLETLTPLIIPDSEGVTENANSHRIYKFFRINGKEMIPGSEIRGVISTVYEALTNSCFRVFEESKYLSWRMKPEEFVGDPKKGIRGFEAGIVKDGKILKVETCRLPLYDDSRMMDKLLYNDWGKKVKEELVKTFRYRKAIEFNIKIAEAAKKNREYLQRLDKDTLKEVLSGKKEVRFTIIPPEKDRKCIDRIAILDDGGDQKGYIKFTGPNNANINRCNKSNEGYREDWDIRDIKKLPLLTEIMLRVSNKQKYPRPHLIFIKDGVEYTISKRCERVFLILSGSPAYDIPPEISKRYRLILEDYRNYSEKIDPEVRKNFCTISTIFNKKELSDGDLVYFHLNDNGEVDAIIPVCISRKYAKQPLGKKLPDELRPCEREILEEIEPEILLKLPEKMLFRRHPDGLCPACRLFGTTGYKGRVRFGFAEIQAEPEWLKDDSGSPIKQLTLPLLEKPRPTWSMPDDNSEVPGRKFYVHHNGWQRIITGQSEISRTENNRTVEPLAAGNKFRFEVFFENLEDWELGLLLYSLELEPGLAHKMGMAKALGFGSVKIKVNKIDMYRMDSSVDKRGLLQAGFNKLREWFNGEWYKVPHINNLRVLLRFQDDKDVHVRYPSLRQQDDKEGLPGYVELMEDSSETKRQELLTTPWQPWHKRGSENSEKGEIMKAIKKLATKGWKIKQ